MSKKALNSVAVYCGSSPGADLLYAKAADQAGRTLARRGMQIVYGGGGVGMMGVLADAALAEGGQVIGVIPDFLDTRELKHPRLTNLRVTKSMHERKMMMMELSHAFIGLPGGFGTLDELFEVLTWAQLGLHANPVGLLNINGYFTPLLAFLDHMVATGFLSAYDRGRVLVADAMDELLDRLIDWSPPADTKFHLARRVEL